MISFKPKLWTTLSAAVLISAAGLTACNGEGEGDVAAAVGEGGEGGAEGGAGGEAGAQEAYLSVPAESRAALRLAHLRGFFLIAREQTEGPDAAAALAGQGMLEVYEAAPGAFESAGLDKAPLDRAVETGAPADVDAAIAAIDAALTKAGGDRAAIARGLVSIAAGLYNGVVLATGIDTVEYQHSLGAVLSAEKVVAGLADEEAKLEIRRLRELYPAPQAPDRPASIAQVAAQASRVELALN